MIVKKFNESIRYNRKEGHIKLLNEFKNKIDYYIEHELHDEMEDETVIKDIMYILGITLEEQNINNELITKIKTT